MSALWTDIKNAYFSYNGMGINLFFGFAAVLYLLFLHEKKQRNLLIYEIFGILLLVTPLLSNVILQAGGDASENWITYGCLNTAVIAAFAATDYLMKVPSGRERLFVVVMYVLILQAGMTLNYTSEHFSVLKNGYKVPAEVLDIAESIDFLEQPRILAPAEVAGGLREYDTKYAVIYGEGLSFTPENLEQLQLEMESYGCNCVVIETEYDSAEFFDQMGFRKIDTTGHFEVYAKQ